MKLAIIPRGALLACLIAVVGSDPLYHTSLMHARLLACTRCPTHLCRQRHDAGEVPQHAGVLHSVLGVRGMSGGGEWGDVMKTGLDRTCQDRVVISVCADVYMCLINKTRPAPTRCVCVERRMCKRSAAHARTRPCMHVIAPV